MKKTNLTLDKRIEQNLKEELTKSMQNTDFVNLVKRNKLTEEEALQNNSLLLDICDELNNCKHCKGLYMCKNKVSGHVLYPSHLEGNLKFIYMPCKYQKELIQKQEDKENALNDISSARMKDIDINDKNRVEIIKWLKNYYDNYEQVNTLKGLYLHGSFGSGKTYLIAALLNELALKKNAQTEITYFPDLLRNMKEDFSQVEEKVSYLQRVDVLLIDDIGAENVTAWGRDEILGPILQYRMNHKLTTFFTSNLNLEELEKHLAITKDSEDAVKSRRIIERIKQLTDDLELVSANRRK